tara:strand:- start:311 stop:451 length:141 start_codon:yes stop_codon:yes gene_type:complete
LVGGVGDAGWAGWVVRLLAALGLDFCLALPDFGVPFFSSNRQASAL